jgi:hypothetical protein
MEQKQLQKNIKGIELWLTSQFGFDAVNKRHDGRLNKGTRQIKPIPGFETNSHRMKIRMSRSNLPRYNLLNSPDWYKGPERGN